ncbi:hypothetical protein LR68_03866 [Anoxybacillus sp. BCO1]|nr:hypothetical protein LR68_03866 [Anoxybacillus sp. BCO1]
MSTDLKKEKAKKVVDTPVIYCGPNIPKANAKSIYRFSERFA